MTTRGLVGRAEFEALPPEAVLVNAGRGPIVDTDALTDAVNDGDIRGAALDVTDPEPLPSDHDLWRMGNVHVTPHNSGYTPQYPPRRRRPRPQPRAGRGDRVLRGHREPDHLSRPATGA
ncbi:NAD(P)-dependent oxidoreductase [Halorarum salinum]|uniref:NAD(P)-dependent oxidoreductase n=1 Tax=Halorarum salinum TaxID=2743089 RepID=UPI001FE3DE1F|nr:NAD(P)-dependent oxidoreductase [Halobaculum salinum]